MTELPHSIEAERMVLGAVLVNPDLMPILRREVPTRAIWSARNAKIYGAMNALFDFSTPVDLVTLVNSLRRTGDLEAAGGPAYVAGLLDGVPRLTNIAEWCEILRRKAALRDILAAAAKISSGATSEFEVADIVGEASDELLRIASREGRGRGPLDNRKLVKEALDSIDERVSSRDGVVGFRTSLPSLDDLLLGVRGGRMGVIAARLGNGKSMLALQIAAAIAEQDTERQVLFASLEMGGAELMERRLMASAGVNAQMLRTANAAQREYRYGSLSKVAGQLASSNLRIVEDAWTVPEIAQHARVLRHEHGLSAVFVDYFQLLEAPAGKRYETRTVELAGISHSLRKLAKELDVPVIVVAQLNREAADRSRGKDKHRPPEIHEIEGSDSLGKDAHWCVMIDPEPPPKSDNHGLADLYVRKNRAGIKGSTRVEFKGALAKFSELQGGQA